MPRQARSKITLVPEGDLLSDRGWVTSGAIPDETEQAAIPRGYEIVGGVDEALSDIAVPWDYFVGFQSEYVSKAGWWPTHINPQAGSLFVEFLSLAMVRYDGIPFGMWVEFIASPSHGQYVNAKLASIEYAELRPAQRKVTDAIKAANFNRPVN